MRSTIGGFFRSDLDLLRCLRMRVLFMAFLSLAACALVLATGVKSTEERFKTHIGSRLPPAKLDCVQ